MTIDELFAYIEGFTNLERTPGRSMRPYRLDRMERLLKLVGDPHRAFRVVHIAGSKGKGSTGAYISNVLDAAGFKTGLYTSPHVSSYKERITIAGREIDDADLIDGFHEMMQAIPDEKIPDLPGSDSPTTFELLTVFAFIVFRRLECSWAVVETGIGGRLDATNLVSPDRTVITPIELEHTEVLGDTIEAVASEKAGIIKACVPNYIGMLDGSAAAVIRQRCDFVGAPFTSLREKLKTAAILAYSPKFRVHYAWRDGRIDEFTLGMNGDVQVDNAALAITVSRDILEATSVSDEEREEAVRRGLEAAKLPGRMETIDTDPPIVLDAAHTPRSISRLLDAFCALYPEPRGLIFGSVDGKNHREMARILSPRFERIVISTPGTFKRSDPEAVRREFATHQPNVVLERDPAKALDTLLASNSVRWEREEAQSATPSSVLVTGSFYMISEIRGHLSLSSVVG